MTVMLQTRRNVSLVALAALAFSTTAAVAQSFDAQGPAPIKFGQAEGIAFNPVSGAINSIAAHPSDADILYVGAANGGVWKSTNATAATPTWTSLTDDRGSLSIGDIVFDTADASNETLVAGVGRFSSWLRIGGALEGLLRTSDGGATWTSIGADLTDHNVAKLAVHGSRILAAVNFAEPFNCGELGIYRSTDGGATFTLLNMTDNGIPDGVSAAVTADPNVPDTAYASVIFADSCAGASNGVYKTTDGGDNWSKVSDAAMDAVITNDTGLVEIEIGQSGEVYVAPALSGQLAGVFRSDDGGASWLAMDIPGTSEPSFVGIHAGSQGGLHMSLAVDPTDANIVYIGGDRQPLTDSGGFPNSLGASDFSGRLFRGDASAPSGTQWTALTHAGTSSNSAPHADSRDLIFDADGNLIEGDDGGLFKRTDPRSSNGDWFSVNGNLQVTEGHDMAYDSNADIVMTGNQDTGTSQQDVPGMVSWTAQQNGDGGDVAIDTQSLAGLSQSIRYSSFQNLAVFRRRVFDASNAFVSVTNVPQVVISGNPFEAQFKTPVVLNQVNSDRLILGGANGIYESLDQGDTISQIAAGVAANQFGGNTIAYGAAGNEDVLYVGAADNLYVRPTALDPLALVSTPAPLLMIESVALDPTDPAHAFYADVASVYRTDDMGASFTKISDGLDTAASGALRALTFANGAGFDAIVIGTDRGVFAATGPTGYMLWSQLGTDMPNTPIFELQYEPGSDKLIVGTLGRGTFTIDGALASLNQPPNAVDDDVTTPVDTPVVILVADNDEDPDGSLDPTTIEVTTAASDGDTDVDGPNGTITYTPDPGFDGVDTFGYTIKDTEGAISNEAIVTVTVGNGGIDTDGDGVLDQMDNCTLVPNADQRDTNGDLFGNICDADLNNDGVVNATDLGFLRLVFFSADPDADFNGDGVVNAADLGILRIGFFAPPGPSGLVP